MRSFTLTIMSALDLVEPPAWHNGGAAVRVQRNADGSIWAYSYAEGSERWMHVPGIASFRFGSRAEEAVVVPEPGTSPASAAAIEDVYQRVVLPMALHAQGAEVVHASAVLMDSGVVAFCGQSRTGKSTIAYGLHRRGYCVWADDTFVFDSSAEPVQAIPYPHRLRIRADAADYFDLDELRQHDASSWTALEQAQDEPAPLLCVFLLEPNKKTTTPVETSQLGPARALTGVIENAYWFRLDSDRTQQMIRRYFVLATQTPVFRLGFSALLDRLPDILDRVESIVRARATGS